MSKTLVGCGLFVGALALVGCGAGQADVQAAKAASESSAQPGGSDTEPSTATCPEGQTLLSGERGTWCVSQTGSEPDIQVQLFRDGTQVATLLHDDCSWPTAGMSTSGQTIDDGIGLTVFVSAPQDANRVERHSRGGTTSADVVHISTSGPGYAVLHVDYGDESGRLTTDTRQKPKLTPEMEEQLKEACSS